MSAVRFAACLAFLWALPALAQTPIDSQVVAALRQGGNVIVLRHGDTQADQVDAKPFNPADTVHQRQLNDEGRATAKAMGNALHRLKVPVAAVQSSQYNRAVETGTLLGFGTVSTTPALNEADTTTMAQGNDGQGAALRKLAAVPPPAGSNVILVTHKPNVIGAFGKDWFDLGEGEATIVHPDGKGGFTVVGRVPAADWPRLASAP
jgi:phosphohistidine phosphatase SixA